jgi:16S rRNA (adenine1518-N6/adenine1519-N6)-dimethyltransferase
VHAIEIDRTLEPALRDIPRTELRFGDALALDAASLVPPPDKLVANLPYAIATPLLVESLDSMPTVERWCVMVQREVADRLFAPVATKAYGAVSVLVQLVGERTGLHRVPRGAFRPPPNVDSALVAFRRTAPGVPPGVKRLVEAGFAHRRKTLANSLELSGFATRERAQDALARLGLDPGLRAEALAPGVFVALAAELP